jgi:glucose-1-phosphate cytidylyltransferase
MPPVVILCGGQGSRLREETEVLPKPMLPIGDRPILWHIMKLYATHGFKSFVLALGYKGYAIREYFLNYRAHVLDAQFRLGEPEKARFEGKMEEEDWELTLAETGPETLTGGRVARLRRHLSGKEFCLTYGDGVGNIDLARLLEFHRSHGKIGTVTGVLPPGRFGELVVDKTGAASEFNEKLQTTGGRISGGFFVFRKEFLERYFVGAGDECVLEQEPLRKLATDGQLMVYPHDGFWQPMDTYREWKLLNDLWKSGQAPWKVW